MKRKKLTLAKQTLRTLRHPDLGRLRGGYYVKRKEPDPPSGDSQCLDCLIGELNYGNNVGGYDMSFGGAGTACTWL